MNQWVLDRLKIWKESPLQFVQDCIEAVPSDQQAQALHLFPKTNRMTIRSGHGCHAAGTIVHMHPYGLKVVEDIEVGDQILGNDGAPRNVLKLYDGTEQMYRIKYHDHTYYDVNESHILALVCTGNKSEFKTGDKIEITVRDYLTMLQQRPSLKGRFAGYKVSVDYPEVPVIIPPYILGIWLGDGSHNQLEITNIDTQVIDIWQRFGESNGLRLVTTDNKLHRLQGDNKSAVLSAFKHYDLLGNKHIPVEYIFNSKENRLNLLAGLLDTDGYADTRNGLQFQIIQRRKELAEDILFIAQSCGIHATISEKVKSWTYNGIKKYDTYYEVRMSRNTEQIPTQIRKKQYVVEHNKQRSNLHFGFTVEKLLIDNYYGFEIDGNNLYVLGDFTVTHNTGKDACASWMILWFMATRPYPKVVCTAPTNRQLADVLWSELSKWLRRSKFSDEFIIQKDKMFHKEAPKEWWARAVSPSVKASKEEQAETLAGFHGDHLLIVADEASGIPDPVYIPLEGALTQEDNRVLLIGNMTRNSGYFYDSHFHPRINTAWTKLHWDSRKSSNVKPSYPQYMEDKYGKESNVFRIRVMGDPPLDSENTLIPLAWAIQCIGNETQIADDEPIYLGVDVARYGEDSSIIMPRKGNRIYPWDTFQGMNTIDLGARVMANFVDMDASGIACDEIGVGAGVTDWLQKRPGGLQTVFGINTANSSSDRNKYINLRDELWANMREKCMRQQYWFPGQTEKEREMSNNLCDELASLTYELQGSAIKVESKKQAKLRGTASPNIADALGLTEYFSNTAYLLWTKTDKYKKHQERWKKLRDEANNLGSHAWQVY